MWAKKKLDKKFGTFRVIDGHTSIGTTEKKILKNLKQAFPKATVIINTHADWVLAKNGELPFKIEPLK